MIGDDPWRWVILRCLVYTKRGNIFFRLKAYQNVKKNDENCWQSVLKFASLKLQ